jgi:hypothetical protein
MPAEPHERGVGDEICPDATVTYRPMAAMAEIAPAMKIP